MAHTPSKAAAPRGAGRVAFLAVKDDVVKAIKAGHSSTAIYNRLKARLGISYPQFARYVAKYIPPPLPVWPAPNQRRGAGRVAFIAAKDEIAKLIESGLSLREIYEGVGDSLGIGYPQFTRYVSRYLSNPSPTAAAAAAVTTRSAPPSPAPGKPADRPSPSTPEKKQTPILRKFSHVPSPKKDDLI